MRQLNRRRLLQSGVAAGVLGLTGLPLRAQSRGGKLTAGLGGAHGSDSWDARTHTDMFMIAACHGAVFDCLTEVAADGSLKGELAESWEASPDAKVWTFNLRGGVTFHNGKPFGADDVIESLQLHLGAAPHSPARPLVEPIVEMKKMSDRQVQLTLAAGNADFPYLMSDYHLVIYPAGQIAAAMAQGIGTGLYAVAAFEPGVRFVGKRVEGHYKGDSAGWFDAVEYIAINDNAARTRALLAGQVDAINRIDLKAEARLRANPRITLQEVTGNQHYSFPMRTQTDPFTDVNIRRALKYGINRQEMVDKILRGHGQVANDTPIGPASQYYNAEMEQMSYDPDKSKFYLKQAGLDGINIDLSASDVAFEGAVEAAHLYQAAAAKGGVTINVIPEPADGYWSKVWQVRPFCTSCWSGRATEDWMFATGAAAGVAWNETQWNHARFQELLSAGRAELDSVRRREIYHEMQQILRDDGGAVIPMFASFVQGVATRIAYPETVGNLWQMDNARMAERWWRA